MYLRDSIKKKLVEIIGLSYDKIITMDDEEIEEYFGNKKSLEPVWPKNGQIDGVPIITKEETYRRLTSRGRSFKKTRRLNHNKKTVS